MSGGVIAYQSKTQSLTPTSSTEAEFIAAVSSGKVAKYLCSILGQLGFTQTTPTPICKDNESAIKMTNADCPTERSRHIDIQYFTLQDWGSPLSTQNPWYCQLQQCPNQSPWLGPPLVTCSRTDGSLWLLGHHLKHFFSKILRIFYGTMLLFLFSFSSALQHSMHWPGEGVVRIPDLVLFSHLMTHIMGLTSWDLICCSHFDPIIKSSRLFHSSPHSFLLLLHCNKSWWLLHCRPLIRHTFTHPIPPVYFVLVS
jgi:hypothetical protein